MHHLVLLLLKGGLGLLQRALQLLLLDLKTSPLFVQLMYGAASLTKLVKQILDLLRQVLVLTLHRIKLLVDLFPRGAETEHLRIVVPALALACLQLRAEVLHLQLPLADHLVEVLRSLVGNDGGSVDPLKLKLEVFKLGVHPVFGLLRLLQSHLQLRLVPLKLVDPAEPFSLVLGTPELDLCLSFAQLLQDLRLLLGLLLNPLPHGVELGGEVLELAHQGGSVPSLRIRQPLGVVQLSRQRDLGLAQLSNVSLSVLDLPGKVLTFHSQLLLARVGLVQSASHLVKLLICLTDLTLGQLALLLHGLPAPDRSLQGSLRLLKLPLQTTLLCLSLGLRLVQLVDGATHLRNHTIDELNKSKAKAEAEK